jgi:hypothetical protein
MLGLNRKDSQKKPPMANTHFSAGAPFRRVGGMPSRDDCHTVLSGKPLRSTGAPTRYLRRRVLRLCNPFELSTRGVNTIRRLSAASIPWVGGRRPLSTWLSVARSIPVPFDHAVWLPDFSTSRRKRATTSSNSKIRTFLLVLAPASTAGGPSHGVTLTGQVCSTVVTYSPEDAMRSGGWAFSAARPSERPGWMAIIGAKPVTSRTSRTCALTPHSAKTAPEI